MEPGTLKPRAHVTILPPRPLSEGVCQQIAWDFIRDSLRAEPPLDIGIGDIEVFPETNVVYASVDTAAFERLQQIHRRLNAQCVQCKEKFLYHPHITLAQNLTADQASHLAAEAKTRWQAYQGPRTFQADTLTFVQEKIDKRWADLEQISLAPQPVRG
jgi:2'-5' RNA ligase